jgi:hypothetical protein
MCILILLTLVKRWAYSGGGSCGLPNQENTMQLSSRPVTVALATGAIALSGVGVAYACSGGDPGHPGKGPTGASGATGTTGAQATANKKHHSRRHARRHARRA